MPQVQAVRDHPDPAQRREREEATQDAAVGLRDRHDDARPPPAPRAGTRPGRARRCVRTSATTTRSCTPRPTAAATRSASRRSIECGSDRAGTRARDPPRRRATTARVCRCRSTRVTGRARARRAPPSARLIPRSCASETPRSHPQRARPPQHAEHDERPEQVELLFDRERPHVPQRRRLRELVEVRLPREHEPPVGDVADRRRSRRRGSGRPRPARRTPLRTRRCPRSRGRAQGSRRRARRSQNAGRSMRPRPAHSVTSSEVIRKPLSTKNVSTPR